MIFENLGDLIDLNIVREIVISTTVRSKIKKNEMAVINTFQLAARKI
jgi:hypothetical protein